MSPAQLLVLLAHNYFVGNKWRLENLTNNLFVAASEDGALKMYLNSNRMKKCIMAYRKQELLLDLKHYTKVSVKGNSIPIKTGNCPPSCSY